MEEQYEDGEGPEHIYVTVDLTGPFEEMVSLLQRVSYHLEALTKHLVKGNDGPEL
jgi:hypothetical protein